MAFGAAVIGMFLVACGGEDEPRNAVEVAPAGCDGDDCSSEEAPAKEATRTAKGGAPASDPQAPGATPSTSEPVAAPSTENTCQTAVDLGSMAGEPKALASNVETFSTQGRCTTWVKIRVNETSNFSDPMQVQATLISPSSHKFDLLGYVNEGKDEVECATPTKTSATTTSSVDSVNLQWGDDWLDSDSRTVVFQVKSRDGKCDPTNTWSLVVKSAVVSLIPGQ